MLGTLAERLGTDGADDLATRLPRALRTPLHHGMERHPAARGCVAGHRMPVEEFVAVVASREDVTAARARDHARAVIATLRDALGRREFCGLRAELPPAYVDELSRP